MIATGIGGSWQGRLRCQPAADFFNRPLSSPSTGFKSDVYNLSRFNVSRSAKLFYHTPLHQRRTNLPLPLPIASRRSMQHTSRVKRCILYLQHSCVAVYAAFTTVLERLQPLTACPGPLARSFSVRVRVQCHL